MKMREWKGERGKKKGDKDEEERGGEEGRQRERDRQTEKDRHRERERERVSFLWLISHLCCIFCFPCPTLLLQLLSIIFLCFLLLNITTSVYLYS